MIDLVTRAEWGARAPRGAYSPLASTRGVKVHLKPTKTAMTR